MSRKITLKSSDGELFEVDEAVALQSETMIEADNILTLPNVTSEILAKVIEYCKMHVESPEADDRAAADELNRWDLDFINLPDTTLLDLIRAAHHLKIKGLVDLACSKVADRIKGKTAEQIREYFNI
ncbi:hypothetical protein PTKIN_Ptkin12aG0186100 [Pterospermum kingtungense]